MYCKYYLNLHQTCLVSRDYSAISNAAVFRVNDLIIKNFSIPAAILLAIISTAVAAGLDTARIDQITGLKGKVHEIDGVYRVTFQRHEAKQVLDAWTRPACKG